MKTSSLRSIMVSWIATIIALVGSLGLAFGQTTTQINLVRQKATINKDVARIGQLRDKLTALRGKTMDEITADEAVTTRSQLIKARADLGKAKAYLRADKFDLLQAHQAFIDERRSSIDQDKANLRATEKSLKAALANGNSMASYYAQQMVDMRNNLRQNQTALKQEITSRNDDLLATNKKIRDVKGEPAATLAFEDSWAKNQNALVAK